MSLNWDLNKTYSLQDCRSTLSYKGAIRNMLIIHKSKKVHHSSLNLTRFFILSNCFNTGFIRIKLVFSFCYYQFDFILM